MPSCLLETNGSTTGRYYRREFQINIGDGDLDRVVIESRRQGDSPRFLIDHRLKRIAIRLMITCWI